MKKLIRLTESDITRLVRKVLNEQGVVTSVETPPKVNKSQQGYIGVDKSKPNPQEYYKNFPCIGSKTVRFQNGIAVTIKGGKVLLPKEGYDDQSYKQVRKGANQGLVGSVQGGGVYFCMSEYPDVLLMT